MAFLGVFKSYFPPRIPCFFLRIHTRLGTMPFRVPQVFHDIARFECFTDLNLFKYVFNVIQNWKQMLYNFIQWCLFFVSSYGRSNRPLLTALHVIWEKGVMALPLPGFLPFYFHV